MILFLCVLYALAAEDKQASPFAGLVAALQQDSVESSGQIKQSAKVQDDKKKQNKQQTDEQEADKDPRPSNSSNSTTTQSATAAVKGIPVDIGRIVDSDLLWPGLFPNVEWSGNPNPAMQRVTAWDAVAANMNLDGILDDPSRLGQVGVPATVHNELTRQGMGYRSPYAVPVSVSPQPVSTLPTITHHRSASYAQPRESAQYSLPSQTVEYVRYSSSTLPIHRNAPPITTIMPSVSTVTPTTDRYIYNTATQSRQPHGRYTAQEDQYTTPQQQPQRYLDTLYTTPQQLPQQYFDTSQQQQEEGGEERGTYINVSPQPQGQRYLHTPLRQQRQAPRRDVNLQQQEELYGRDLSYGYQQRQQEERYDRDISAYRYQPQRDQYERDPVPSNMSPQQLPRRTQQQRISDVYPETISTSAQPIGRTQGPSVVQIPTGALAELGASNPWNPSALATGPQYFINP